ncbi:hypothetical protein SLE2022_177410 [Rubroshorea leprosula]
MALAAAVLLLLLASPVVFAANYIVGDGNGWNQGVDYNSWTQGKTFNVGDTLLFTYGGNHGVDVVDKSDYDNCVSSNALNSYSNGNTTVTLSKAGSMYFMCPTLGHCSSGMKLEVTVGSSSSSPPGTTTPSGTTTPTSTNKSGAARASGNINGLVVGSLLLLGSVLAIMG